ncbi:MULTISPECIES: GTP-binding protein [Bizionia]|uniref:GTP-binding protein n=1 Tax=Bizionia hallyeonensis TaxID=1123757 RepID=A0ABW0C824_9FLAO|nr:GTP-binding protein [Bizionia sp. M204]UPS91943.1 GTP-binding protein [Bizionia sp. M204]
MSLHTDEIVLRPRFKKELPQSNTDVIQLFADAKKQQSEYIISIIDDHIFLKLPKSKQHFWSPQLHLEVNEVNHETAMLHGLFGPNPTVWTMFMFFHFIVGGLFIGFGVWAYSNWTLDNEFAIQIGVMVLMVIIWIGMYFAGRIGRDSSKDQMHELHEFMEKIINA